ncbi:AEC family transporter [Falsiroseomonas sp. HW251]|uniref:AEC family transporter n=1 Tax=Falsiroseomonas sp. HW251 TaxID=3390998 RepID=UPI003D3238C7
MAAIVEVVLPVFALIALGYAAARLKLVDDLALKGLAFFVFAFAAPALLFSGGTRPHEPAGGAALVTLVAGVAVFLAMLAVGRRAMGLALPEAALFAFACVFGNTVMMGIPLIVAAYGQPGLPPLLAILGVQTVAIIGMATVAIEIGLAASAPIGRVLRATVTGVARNPVLVAVLLAMVWNATGLPVPGPLRRTLEMLGAASPPVALFCLGASLVGLSAASFWRETALIAAVKLVAMPAVAFALCRALGLTPVETAVAVTMAGLPTGANAFILARRYATGADRSGSAVVATTALSVLTLGAMIAHFRQGLP